MNSKHKGTLIAAVVAGLVLSGHAMAKTPVKKKAAPNVKCMGVNACKGHGMCKSADNSCKGMNSCKGKGMMMMKESKCVAKGGSVVKE